jgi:hypothetical protein
MSTETVLDVVQERCIEIAEALESRFTPRRAKLAAAVILRNAATDQPHCSFCGAGPSRGCTLHTSPIKPKTWICDSCAMYVAIYLTRLSPTSEVEHDRWLRFKDFAP